jgi:hypothetical protein
MILETEMKTRARRRIQRHGGGKTKMLLHTQIHTLGILLVWLKITEYFESLCDENQTCNSTTLALAKQD